MEATQLKFKNKSNYKIIDGEVLPDDTVEMIIADLKKQPEFSNLNDNLQLKTEDGRILEPTKTFHELELTNGYTLVVEEIPLQNPGTDDNTLSNNATGYLETGEPSSAGIPKDRAPRPVVPRTFHQLGIFVLDGSYSMHEECQGGIRKREAVNLAIRELLGKFKKSRAVNNFSFAVVTFDIAAKVITETTSAISIHENADYDPIKGSGNGTYIHSGLSEAKKLAESFLIGKKQNDVPHSVVIVLLSDGECHEPDKTKSVAEDIISNPQIKICTTFFSKMSGSIPEAELLMKEIASAPTLFENTYDVETLRKFFESSISRISN